MSLRVRLALLYTAIMGGTLLLFGAAVYIAVSISLTNQLDRMLEYVARDIIAQTKASTPGPIQIDFSTIDLSPDLLVQL
jgi:HAMP domain-containing protein